MNGCVPSERIIKIPLKKTRRIIAWSPLKEADMRVIPQNRYSPWRIFLVLLALTVLLVPAPGRRWAKDESTGRSPMKAAGPWKKR